MKKLRKNSNYISNIKLHDSKILNALLQSRGFTTLEEVQDFLYPKLEKLNDPLLFRDMNKAISLIEEAKKSQTKVMIFHDYDCDGVCASYVLSQALMEIGINVTCSCPSREEGYGLNISRIEQIAKEFGLLITVDLGISNYDEIELAKKLGLKTIISDHHQLPDKLPQSDAIIHPLIEPYPYKYLCGTGVAYKIACALIGKKANNYIDIVSIATIGDIVALTGENRIIVKYGLDAIKNTNNYGIKALLKISGLYDYENINSRDVAFKIVPRINVAGRLDSADLARKLLNAENEDDAEDLANIIEKLNTERKEIENNIINDIDEKLRNFDFINNRFIVVSGENWNSGVVGLAAGRIAENYHLPVAVFSISGDKATASVRSIKGFNVYKLLKHCSHLFIKWGGHEQAGGLTMLTKNIEEFSQEANKYIFYNINPFVFIPYKEYDQEISVSDVNIDNCNLIDMCEPFGQDNSEPNFLIKNAQIIFAKKVGSNGNHLKLSIADENSNYKADAIAFGFGNDIDRINTSADILANIQKNTFNYVTKAQLNVKAIEHNKDTILNYINQISDDLFNAYKLDLLCKSLIIKENNDSEYSLENFEINDIFGTLVISFNRENIHAFYDKYSDYFDIAIHIPNSNTSLNTLIINPCFEQLNEFNYNRIIVLDGIYDVSQVSYIKNIFPNAKIILQDEIADNLSNLYIGIEKYRQLYVNLIKNCYNSFDDLAENLEMSKDQIFFAINIFHDLCLIEFELNSLNIKINKNPSKCSIEENRIIKALMSKGGNYA